MIRSLIGLIALLCVMGASQAQDFSDFKAKYIDLSFTLEVNGVELGKPKATVVVGTPARFSTETFRLDFVVTETFVDDAGNSLAATQLRVFTKAAEASDWLLVGEPTMLTQLNGAAASIMETSKNSSVGLVLSTMVITKDALAERFGGEIPEAKQCPEAGAKWTPAEGPCCTKRCAPGTTFTCCGAINCCGCSGTICCRPV